MNDRNDNEEDLSYLEVPVDQHLTMRDVHIIAIKDTENPPEFDIVMDIEHVETAHQWRQSVNIGREQFAQYLEMLIYAAKTAGVEFNAQVGD